MKLRAARGGNNECLCSENTCLGKTSLKRFFIYWYRTEAELTNFTISYLRFVSVFVHVSRQGMQCYLTICLVTIVWTVTANQWLTLFSLMRNFAFRCQRNLVMGISHLPAGFQRPVNSLPVPPVYPPLQVYSPVCCWYLEAQLVLPGIQMGRFPPWRCVNDHRRWVLALFYLCCLMTEKMIAANQQWACRAMENCTSWSGIGRTIQITDFNYTDKCTLCFGAISTSSDQSPVTQVHSQSCSTQP